MGELLVKLTDIYFKHKRELKRKPFADRSNLSYLQESAVRRKSTRIRRSKRIVCNCCFDDKLNKALEMIQFKELKVVLRRFDNDLCSSNKRNKQLRNPEANSVVESPNNKGHLIRQLQISLSRAPNLIEKVNERSPFKHKLRIIKGFNTSKSAKPDNINQSSNDNSIQNSEQIINNVQFAKIFSNNQEREDIETLRKSDNIASISILNSPIIKKLRNREKKNYLEISSTSLLDNSSSVDICKKKVPIYKQFGAIEIVNKTDPYELDISDLEERKDSTKKCSRRNLSEKFDKTMFEIIKKLDQKHKKKTKKRPGFKNVLQYDNNIKSVLQRVMKKVDGNKNVSKNFNELLDTGQLGVYTSVCHNLPQDKPQFVQNFKNNSQNNEALLTQLVPKIINKIPLPSYDVCDNLDNESHSGCNSDKEPVEDNVSLSYDLDKENEVCFGFDDNDKPLSSNQRINIISNVEVNSTQKRPWRLDGLRNPNYIIHFKKNSLPCLDQDVIVNYNLSEKIGESFLHSNTRPQTLQKTNIQTSILDYVDSSLNTNSNYAVENRPENVFSHSLYNYEEFDTNYLTGHVNRDRKILGVIQNNILSEKVAVSTPVKDNTRIMPALDISVIEDSQNSCLGKESEFTEDTLADENNSNFGFNSAISEIELGQKYSNEARPFRISMDIIKKYKRCNHASYTNHGENLPSVLISNECDYKSSEDIGIFDEVEPELLMTEDAVSN